MTRRNKSAVDMTGCAAIVIERRSGSYRDAARSYRVEVGDVEIGRLKAGRSLKAPLAPGRHKIVVRIDWSEGKPLGVDLSPGETINLTVRPDHDPWSGFFSRDRWLVLDWA